MLQESIRRCIAGSWIWSWSTSFEESASAVVSLKIISHTTSWWIGSTWVSSTPFCRAASLFSLSNLSMMLLSHDVCQPIPEELIVPYKIKPSIALIVHCYTIQSFNWVLLLHHLIEYFIIQIIFLIKYLRMAWRLILVWIIDHFKFIFFKRPWLLCSFRRRDLLIRELLCLVLFKCVIQIVHPFPGPRQLNIFEEFSLFLLPPLSGTFFHSSLLFSESFLISSHLLPLHLHLSCSLFF